MTHLRLTGLCQGRLLLLQLLLLQLLLLQLLLLQLLLLRVQANTQLLPVLLLLGVHRWQRGQVRLLHERRPHACTGAEHS
jgi:hypothetical protein